MNNNPVNSSAWNAQIQSALLRRHFLKGSAMGVGSVALTSLLKPRLFAQPHFVPKAKRVIYLFMSGGPSHVDIFDEKPELKRLDGKPIPESFVDGVHFAMIDERVKRPKLKASPFQFERRGKSGLNISSLMPHLSQVADELAVIKGLRSEVFNHDPAVNLLNTGDSRLGRPTMGAWLSYGLGNETQQLPSYVVLTSGVKRQPLLNSYWSNGFLPSEHQGVRLRNGGDPILFLSSPAEIQRIERRSQIDLIRKLNEKHFQRTRDREIISRIEQYETAFHLQASAPELVDLKQESQATLDHYGADPKKPSFANNCLLARRLAERGVRFIQLYDMGWDSHDNLFQQHQRQCKAVDQPIAALIQDLKQRGLLEETLVIWGGEFGRTPVIQGGGKNWGRDHHPHGFSMWLAGGGVQGGITYGETDDFGFHATENKTSVHDLHATVLHLLGIDHKRLTYRHQGRDFRLTDVAGEVVRAIIG